MPRKKKTAEAQAVSDAADRVAAARAAVPPNGIGHNSGVAPELTDDQKQRRSLELKKQLLGLIEKKDTAVANIRNLKKTIRADLGADGVKLVEAMIALDTEDGEARAQAEIERTLQAARYMAIPLGSQFEMFPDRMPAEDRAFAEGKRDAMEGTALRNHYDPGVPQHDQYARGWHHGQSIVTQSQKASDVELFASMGESPEEAELLAQIEEQGIEATVGRA